MSQYAEAFGSDGRARTVRVENNTDYEMTRSGQDDVINNQDEIAETDFGGTDDVINNEDEIAETDFGGVSEDKKVEGYDFTEDPKQIEAWKREREERERKAKFGESSKNKDGEDMFEPAGKSAD